MKYTPEEKMMFGITIGTDIETYDQQEILLQEQIELEDKKMDMIEQGQLGDDYSRKDNFDLIGNIDMDSSDTFLTYAVLASFAMGNTKISRRHASNSTWALADCN